MNYYKRTTQVPNVILDKHLVLSEKELKVLLVVVRQTLGWMAADGKRKQRDWISQGYFSNKTGLSRKSVSAAIELLVQKRLIKATSFQRTELFTPSARKGQAKIYYQLGSALVTNLLKASEKRSQDPGNNLHNTKPIYTKLNIPNSSVKHIKQVLSNKPYGPHSDSQ